MTTTASTAELTKLVENASRDAQIAFANELSMIANQLEIDVWEVIRLANHHPRVNILQPGPGVGGHCIAVDPWFIVHSAPEHAKLISTARNRNLQKTEWVTKKISDTFRALSDKLGRPARIALMGLAFKPNIDDLRESPALYVAYRLLQAKLPLNVVEPNITAHAEFELREPSEAVMGADIVVYLVAHREFMDLPDSHATVLDFCGVSDRRS